MAKVPKHLRGMFDEDEEGECPPLKPAMIQAAEKKLGYTLPAAYLELLKVCNGGTIRRSVFPTDKCPAWADDHVAFETVMGIGEDEGIDSEYGSAYLIAEWDYPDVGVVISSDGHTAFLLDYSECGEAGEPRVIWVDTETGRKKPDVVVLAPDLATFL
jgi:hypothetical protein